MDNEISKGTNLGVVLLALAAVIGLGFSIFMIAKNLANDGTSNVQDTLQTVSEQIFADFDQKVVTGTQLLGAIKNFNGKPYALLIATKAFNNTQQVATVADHPIVYTATQGTTTLINYNAILAGQASGSAPRDLGSTDPRTKTSTGGAGTALTLTMTNGTVIAPFGFYMQSGGIVYDSNTAGIYKSGNAEYIPVNTKFQAYLIKDASGTTMGIYAKQL
ncbi:hypothetical protein D3C71_1258300 [compost metagenome]